nr:hypothetical protein [Fodinicola feengrottensis]
MVGYREAQAAARLCGCTRRPPEPPGRRCQLVRRQSRTVVTQHESAGGSMPLDARTHLGASPRIADRVVQEHIQHLPEVELADRHLTRPAVFVGT